MSPAELMSDIVWRCGYDAKLSGKGVSVLLIMTQARVDVRQEHLIVVRYF